MITLLLLIVIHAGEPKYLVTKHDSMTECQLDKALALDEFKAAQPEIKVIRAECIQTGVSV